MSEINTTLKSTRLMNTSFDIPRNIPATFDMKVERKAQFKVPKDPEMKSILLNVELHIHAPEVEGFQIVLNGDSIFAFDVMPEDCKSVVEATCMPIAEKQMFKMLNEILVSMGHQKLDLNLK